MAAKVLIIEDDRHFGEMLRDVLELDDLAVQHVATAEAGLDILRKRGVHLLILDFDLPGMNGLQLLKRIRQADAGLSELLVMMLTVKGDESHLLKGLDFGADDYVVKSASLQEIQARVRTLLRRLPQARSQVALKAGPLRLDFEAHEAAIEDRKIALTQGEFDILAALLRRPGIVLSYAVLGEALTTSKEGTSQVIYVHINSLRKKLGRHGGMIETIRGLGYKLVAL